MSSQDLNLTLEGVTKTYRKGNETTNTEQTQTERSSDCARKRDRREIKFRANLIRENAFTVVKKKKGKRGKFNLQSNLDCSIQGCCNSKGSQIERKFPAISAWTVKHGPKRFADEKRSGAFGRERFWTDLKKPVVDLNLGKLWLKLEQKHGEKTLSRKLSARDIYMLTVASTSQPAETSTLLDDDPIFNDEGFLAAVSAMEKHS
nr:uncharacterized protein LOC109172327 [Ipomoea batatas]